jgi:diguanylate cyclase (GGDEF)-like protein
METQINQPTIDYSERETAFVLARLGIILALGFYVISLPTERLHPVLAWVLLSAMGLHLGIYWWLMSAQRLNLRELHRLTFFLDSAAISLFCLASGGLESPFYLLLYFTIAYAAVALPLSEVLAFAFLSTFLYLTLHLNQLGKIPRAELVIRLTLIWLVGTFASFISKHFRESETRLRKILNVSSQRTQELERANQKIETIYQASSSMAKLMTLEQIIEKILSIVQQVLSYRNFSILLLSGEEDALELKAKIEGGKTIRYDQTQRFNLTGVWGEVVRNATAERVVDVQTDPREVLAEKKEARSQLSVPIVVGGKVFGILNAESQQVGYFLDQDQKILTILAIQAALAIENFQLHSKTEELTILDELTQAYNFRYFKNKLDEEFKRAKRYNQPLSLIMMDIDWFKRCNDTYGHRFGNVVLKELVKTCDKCVRDVDVVCRYGGEEFVVILPQTNKDDAKIIAERIRQSFGQLLVEMDKIKTRNTVSLGVATCPEDADEPEQLIEKVDQALYQAKGQGKNRVCTPQEPLVPSK